MQYRKFGNFDQEISALGFGAMRLPTTGHIKDIDEPAATEMLRHAIDGGVTYVDSAYVYHEGNSERFLGRALQDGYREKISLATKSPIWKVEKHDDFDRFLDEQLERLQTERIDFYLLHCLQKRFWPKMQELEVFRFAERARADGRIGQFGFSFHDGYDVFREIVDAYDWSFCQIQYNYVNEDVQAGTKGLDYAADKGLGVIVMEPLYGGTLASPPTKIQAIWDDAPPDTGPVDLALRWLWNKPAVSLVLSGMSTLEQVQQNLASADRSEIGSLSDEELELVARLQSKYAELTPIPCTRCGYCMPCRSGVDIPVNLGLYNDATVFEGSAGLCRNLYRGLADLQQATHCTTCGECEERCPQQIEIAQLMPKIHAKFE
ncbi:MAG: aldo/keto reductase [Thermoguttaceae bacterium]